jgi:hypothetical protein
MAAEGGELEDKDAKLCLGDGKQGAPKGLHAWRRACALVVISP